MVPEGLYRLSDRDERTVLIEPFCRRIAITLGATVLTVNTDIAVPADRCLVLTESVLECNAEVSTFWTLFRLISNDSAGFCFWGVGSTAGMPFLTTHVAPSGGQGWGGIVNSATDFLIPPGIQLRAQMSRGGPATNAAAAFLNLNGYLIPPGSIARGF